MFCQACQLLKCLFPEWSRINQSYAVLRHISMTYHAVFFRCWLSSIPAFCLSYLSTSRCVIIRVVRVHTIITHILWLWPSAHPVVWEIKKRCSSNVVDGSRNKQQQTTPWAEMDKERGLLNGWFSFKVLTDGSHEHLCDGDAWTTT